MKALPENEIEARLREAALWKREKNEIRRTFQLPSFAESIHFVNQIAAYADQVDHHPDILVQYNKVTLTLSTHDAGGITEKDFAAAAKADELFSRC
jgi:4a-hydroxytetrahydrobiopterin dehydratase